MRLDTLPQYFFQYKYATRPMEDGRSLPVSGPTFPDDDVWVTIPWDTVITSPADTSGIYQPPSPATGTFWSFLYGPCVFSMTAALGVGEVTPGTGSIHFQPYASSNDVENVASAWEGWEEYIGPSEGNTCHFYGSWWGYLPANQRLRLRVDYWHGDHAAKFNRAHVEGCYWRLPA